MVGAGIPVILDAPPNGILVAPGDQPIDQPVGAAFGAQAGFAKLSSAIMEGGFGKVRKATETPFNMILEARA